MASAQPAEAAEPLYALLWRTPVATLAALANDEALRSINPAVVAAAAVMHCRGPADGGSPDVLAALQTYLEAALFWGCGVRAVHDLRVRVLCERGQWDAFERCGAAAPGLHTPCERLRYPRPGVQSPLSCRLIAKATSEADVGVSRLRFDPHAALALARRHGRARAARRLLVTLGHLSDAVDCADAEPATPSRTPTRALTHSQSLAALAAPPPADAASGAEAVLAAAAPEQQRLLWLQVLQHELAAPGTAEASARVQSAEALVQRSGDVLQTEDLLPLLPEVAGSAADAVALLRRVCAAERSSAAGLAEGLDGMEERTQRRRRALRAVEDYSGPPRRRKCGVCGRELAAAPGSGALFGAVLACGALRPWRTLSPAECLQCAWLLRALLETAVTHRL